MKKVMFKKVAGWFFSLNLFIGFCSVAFAEAATSGDAAGAASASTATNATGAANGAGTAAAAATGGAAYSQILLLVAFGLIFYFIIMRPQSKRAKEHRQLISNLQKGDEVITSGGILGKVTKVTDNFLIIAIAEGVEVPIQRQAIAMNVPKGTLKSLS